MHRTRTPQPMAQPVSTAAPRQMSSVALVAAVLLTLVTGLLGTGAAQAQGSEQEYRLDIPAGTLESALTKLSTTTGVSVSFTPEMAKGRETAGLIGRYTAEEALHRLLAGSELSYRFTGANTVTLAAAQEGNGPIEAKHRLPDLMIYDQAPDPLTSSKVLDAEAIRQRPTGDGNLTDLLRVNPAVQFSNSSNGMDQGEIKPENISIHGSRAYQNSFRLDGMSLNNDLNPADPNLGVTLTNLGSDTQGFYLDSRLVDSVTVYDANVPVEFGGFTGGSIDAQSRSWRSGQSGQLYYRHTDASWNRTHVDHQLDFDSSENSRAHPSRFQPDYRKHSFGLNFETGLTDRLGVVFSMSRRESMIPSQHVGGLSIDLDETGEHLVLSSRADKVKNQTRTSDQVFSKLSWYPQGGTELHWSTTYTGYNSSQFLNGAANSDYEEEHSGIGSQLQWQQQTGWGQSDFNLSWQQLEDERISEQKYSLQLEDLTDWEQRRTYDSGGPGDLISRQENISARQAFSWHPIVLGELEQRFRAGAEVTRTEAEYERREPFFRNGFIMTEGMGGEPNLMGGQVEAFFAGRHRTQFTQSAVFAENNLNYGRWNIRPGVRLDRDDFVEETNFSPRFVASLDVFGDQHTRVTAGANRYYGRSMLTYALYEAQNAGLHLCYWGCTPNSMENEWNPARDYEGMADLSTPYSDERSLSVSQLWGPTSWDLSYVQRDNHDEVRSRPKYPGTDNPQEARIRTFDNGGRSEHESVSLTISHLDDVAIGATTHHWTVTAAWQESASNTPKDQGYAFFDPNTNLNMDYVDYRGKIIRADELPSTDFNVPFRVKAELTSVYAPAQLSLYQSWHWESSRDQATRHANEYTDLPDTDQQVLKYEQVDYASTFRWDMKLRWEPSWAQGIGGSVEVTNVLNNRNATDAFVHSDKVYRSYAPGRQFWLQLDYSF
ncbi:TonB-dependent receptor [Halomonas llamarensis]|uniref:TonB-dependent receptor plug domain-containing protein n=1 Tax=Halomonas llamarensis TaxID=2945104 RepID=A0ABT0SUJ4_9GAMM|nr:secretin and TonB N-terminal domain-containing protein [Halomonas llamarensis]MCL7931387.1 TonB-dependent receptor plug domain-containing protein [Halomonas llamarensis]